MRMRQSLAQFEAAFYEETVEDRRRRERLRREAAQRSYVRRVAKRTKHGNWRFVVLLLAMVATAAATDRRTSGGRRPACREVAGGCRLSRAWREFLDSRGSRAREWRLTRARREFLDGRARFLPGAVAVRGRLG